MAELFAGHNNHVQFDEGDDSYYQFTPAEGKFAKVTKPQIMSLVINTLERLVAKELTTIQCGKVQLAALSAFGDIERLTDGAEKQLRAAHRQLGTNSQQAAIFEQLKPFVFMTPTTVPDNVPYLVHFIDGKYDLDTGVFMPSDPADHNRFTTAYRYHEPGWEECVPTVMGMLDTMYPDAEVRDCVVMMLGAVVSGKMDLKKFFVLCDASKGNNGKSLMVSMISAMLGNTDNYFFKAPRKMFSADKINTANSATPYMFAHVAKRVSVAEELSRDEPLHASLLKELTSGYSVPIACRAMYSAPITFHFQAKLVLVANHRQFMVSDRDDQALHRRIVAIPHKVTFISDSSLVCPPYIMLENSELAAEMRRNKAYARALFSIAVQGYKMLYVSKVGAFDDAKLSPIMMQTKRALIKSMFE